MKQHFTFIFLVYNHDYKLLKFLNKIKNPQYKYVVLFQVTALIKDLVLCGAALRRVGEVFDRELHAGLRDQPSSLQMANTYVPEMPNGSG